MSLGVRQRITRITPNVFNIFTPGRSQTSIEQSNPNKYARVIDSITNYDDLKRQNSSATNNDESSVSNKPIKFSTVNPANMSRSQIVTPITAVNNKENGSNIDMNRSDFSVRNELCKFIKIERKIS